MSQLASRVSKKIMTEKTSDIVLIDKPKGITSFDVIRQLRKKLGIRKMGHAGTLDPLATGLLLIGVGAGTKKLAKLVGLSKVYETEIILGLQTTTGDMEGQILAEANVLGVDREKVEEVLSGLAGVLQIAVPLFSAVKIDGKPLYAYAREGKKVEAPVKDMKIFSMELTGMREEKGRTVLSVRMHVGSGAYVRSIAEEVGRRLGVPASVQELRRTRIGDKILDGVQFDIADADAL